ncbi:ABC transporter permease [Vibrio sinaloensis]|uniref:ABC transporter permease n=1 Tax=Photobacterium sp. (strain ATCC 43367) TaxID=379097 RepID=UPI00205F1FB6|nr:ABC transporter permease [Vibrio sinaloensis]UPQ87101.1 ABC transporter permease [Vibrio sinaloensis]
MDSVVDISWLTLALFFTSLVVPFTISRYYQLGLSREILVSVARMTLQLMLVGVYLEYLFKLNSLTINIAWILVMTLIGASAIASKAKLPRAHLMLPVACGLLIALVPMLAIIVLAVVKPIPCYNAQYLVPLAGMLLGNSMSGNIVALQNFFNAFEERKSEYEAAISLGASTSYATLPFVRDAIALSLAPSLATMTTTGLVTLPGMMTGQILGGASPIVAIKYQIMIMIAIFVTMSLSIAVSLKLVVKRCIHPHGRVLVKVESSQPH